MTKNIKQTIFFLIFFISHIQSQNVPDEYYNAVKKAHTLLENKDYKNAAISFSEALK